MKNYVIMTDSTSDLPVDIADHFGIQVIPMPFTMGTDSYMHYLDNRELGIHEFYEKLRGGIESTTTQINEITYIEYFESVIKSGSDILYISLSSGLSSTYNSVLLAAEELIRKYPESKILCVDFRAASLGEGLLVYSAAKKKEEGFGLEELSEWIINKRSHLFQWFTVDDLNHLKRGGRLTAMTAVVGTALDIKPILHVDDEGKLIPVDRVRGRKKALKALVIHMSETCTNPEEQIIFIGHGDA
jgi:DegV family protein with EDD domain